MALLFFKVLADEYRTSQQLEKRRLQAIAMLESGKSYQTVANRLSASLSSVVRWVQSYHQEGRAGLKAAYSWPPRSTLSARASQA